MAQGIQIGKVAEQTGLSIDTIRFYQRIGLIRQPARSEGGFRLFTDLEIQDLGFIQKALELGFSLTEIKELSVLNQKHDHACSQVRDLLASKLSDVRQKLAELLRLEGELKKALRKCNRDLLSERGSSHEDCCPLLRDLERKSSKRRTASVMISDGESKTAKRTKFPVSGVRSRVHLTGKREDARR